MEQVKNPDSISGKKRPSLDSKFLQTLINLTPDILYIYDLIEHKNVFCSVSILDILGLSVQELHNYGNGLIKTLMHPDDYSKYLNEIVPRYAFLKDNQFISHKYRMKHKNGSWRILESNEVMYRRQADGTARQIFGVIHDITAAENTRKLLFESERLLKESQEIAHIGHWNWDIANNKVIWSDEIFRIFGVSKDTFSASAEAFDRLVHPDDFPKYSRERQKSIESYTGFSIEHRIVRPDGEIRHVHARSQIDRDERGKITRVFGTVQDITDRKKAENVKRQYDLQVERNQRLESIGILAGGIAHDFNNLLAGVFGNIELAAEETKDKNVADLLAKALSVIDRARALTGQLLTFSKGGVPMKKLEPLSPFIKNIASYALSGSNVSCRFFIPDNLWLCKYDKNQLGQVIDNIVQNARQEMPKGGTVELKAENIHFEENYHTSLTGGDYVKIAIKDNGIGMPEEILPKIFDPFFTTNAKRHGMGLATCYSIIRRHGGYIEAKSESGKGSTFTFFLPASPQEAKTNGAATALKHHGKGSILVMDDEEVVRETLSSVLESMGYKAYCVSNTDQVIKLFERGNRGINRFSAVILDLTIPGGPGGKEAIREIRKIDRDIPAFVSSGYADDPVMVNPTEYGFNSGICKPFRMGELAKLLNKHMQ